MVEDVFEDSEDSEGENTTGIYSVKMRLYNNIPQLLPIDGRRIKIYYRNIIKLCSSCFGTHNRRECREDKVKWIDYVDRFVKQNPHIDPALYGRWTMILEREAKQKQIDREHYLSKQTKEKHVQEHEEEITEELSSLMNDKNSSDKTQAKLHTHENIKTSDHSNPIIGNQSVESKASSQNTEPKPEDFNLPINKEEWDELVEKLVLLGLSNKDANAVIDKRKRLFNTAMKEFNSKGKQTTRKGRPKARKDSVNGSQN